MSEMGEMGMEGDPAAVPLKHAATDAPLPKGSTEKMTFQTETKQILDIVTHSLYTDKEVFLREIVSNSSDALEKARYLQTGNAQLVEPELPFEIHLTVDDKAGTLTIQDYGIGMTRDELISNLGTIARSGSKQFVKELASKGQQAATSIIGQFGVGFYSTFMVASKVEVYSRYADSSKPESQIAHYWVSDGSGSYELSEAEGVRRGTKVILHFKTESKEFANKNSIEAIVKKHSSFIGFPIYLNGEKIQKTGALWLQEKSTVTESQYKEFYQHIAHAYDAPSYRLHFSVDAPISVHALLYFPERHMEKFLMGRMDPGVAVYSKKVLIQPKSEHILPAWARFVKGVVDSEDLPLNISRETMQDSRLMQRLNFMLSRRIIKQLDEEAKKDPKKFNTWYKEFGTFLKEGVCSDQTHNKELAKLLRFDSSQGVSGGTSLDEYVSRMPPEQQNIYYLNAVDKLSALASPYYEACKQKKREVLFLYNPIDDMTMRTLSEFNKRKLISIDSSAMADEMKLDEKKDDEVNADDILPYLSAILHDRTSSVVVATRFFTVPAIIVDVESAGVRKMMKMMASENQLPVSKLQRYKVEVNLSHPLWKKLITIKDSNPQVAQLVVEQLYDNICIAADLVDTPMDMLPRLSKLVDTVLDSAVKKPTPSISSSSDSSTSATASSPSEKKEAEADRKSVV